MNSRKIRWLLCAGCLGAVILFAEKADFLSQQQKRDILYNNAARFLRLSPDQVAKHNGISIK